MASGDATSAFMIRTRVGVRLVTRVPWNVITLQHVSTRCRRRESNDGSLLWTERHRHGWRRRIETPWESALHHPRVQDVELELCVHLMTLQTGRSSTEVDLPHRRSQVLGGSPTQRSERRTINHYTEVVGHSTSTTDFSSQVRTCMKSTCFYRNGDDWSATAFNEVKQHDVP